VRDNVALGLELADVPETPNALTGRGAAETGRTGRLADPQGQRASGGMQQRVGLAPWPFATEAPDPFLMDEPFSLRLIR